VCLEELDASAQAELLRKRGSVALALVCHALEEKPAAKLAPRRGSVVLAPPEEPSPASPATASTLSAPARGRGSIVNFVEPLSPTTNSTASRQPQPLQQLRRAAVQMEEPPVTSPRRRASAGNAEGGAAQRTGTADLMPRTPREQRSSVGVPPGGQRLGTLTAQRVIFHEARRVLAEELKTPAQEASPKPEESKMKRGLQAVRIAMRRNVTRQRVADLWTKAAHHELPEPEPEQLQPAQKAAEPAKEEGEKQPEAAKEKELTMEETLEKMRHARSELESLAKTEEAAKTFNSIAANVHKCVGLIQALQQSSRKDLAKAREVEEKTMENSEVAKDLVKMIRQQILNTQKALRFVRAFAAPPPEEKENDVTDVAERRKIWFDAPEHDLRALGILQDFQSTLSDASKRFRSSHQSLGLAAEAEDEEWDWDDMLGMSDPLAPGLRATAFRAPCASGLKTDEGEGEEVAEERGESQDDHAAAPYGNSACNPAAPMDAQAPAAMGPVGAVAAPLPEACTLQAGPGSPHGAEEATTTTTRAARASTPLEVAEIDDAVAQRCALLEPDTGGMSVILSATCQDALGESPASEGRIGPPDHGAWKPSPAHERRELARAGPAGTHTEQDKDSSSAKSTSEGGAEQGLCNPKEPLQEQQQQEPPVTKRADDGRRRHDLHQERRHQKREREGRNLGGLVRGGTTNWEMESLTGDELALLQRLTGHDESRHILACNVLVAGVTASRPATRPVLDESRHALASSLPAPGKPAARLSPTAARARSKSPQSPLLPPLSLDLPSLLGLERKSRTVGTSQHSCVLTPKRVRGSKKETLTFTSC